MPISPVDFLAGIIVELIRDKVKDKIDNIVSPDDGVSTEELLHDVHTLVLDGLEWFKDSQAGEGDIMKPVTIFKNGLGAIYTPILEGRSHVQAASGVGCTLNAVSTLMGQYNKTIPGGMVWTTIDAPDTTQYILDAGFVNPNNNAASSSTVLFIRLTNQAVF